MDNVRAIPAPIQRVPIIPSASHTAFSSRYPSAPHQPSEYSVAQPYITGSNADGDSYRLASPPPRPAAGQRVGVAQLVITVSLFVIALALVICIVAEASR